tara:strand:- start:73 stop:261 length:189 start_codon:yes stop_codon:yes gene_type:complete
MIKRYVKIAIKKIDGEYCVQWIENGKIDEPKCYYTDCKKDAEYTARTIVWSDYSINNNIYFI